MKLLIADDQQSLHTFLDKMMDWRKLGITDVRHAYNGKEMADLSATFGPDLLIMDIRMPEMNGIEALKSIRAQSHQPKTIILSAYDEFEYAQEALQLHVSRYLLKPVDALQLQETLTQLIREIRREMRSRLESEWKKAVFTNHYSEDCLSHFQKAFFVFGIIRYAVVTVREVPSSATDPDTWRWTFGPVMAFSLPPREETGELTLLAGMTEEIDPDAFRRLCERQLSYWQTSVSAPSLSMGISRMASDVRLLPRLAAESAEAARRSFYDPGTVQVYSDSLFTAGSECREIHGLLKTFEETVLLGISYEAAAEQCDRLFKLLRDRKVVPDFAYEIGHRILTALLRSRGREAMSEKDPAFSVLALRDACRKFDELVHFIKETMVRIMREWDGHGSGLRQLIRSIRRYVDDHVDADLSLQAMADRFGIDKFRISREFKREFGENYWHYVTRIRMEKAAFLLTATDWTNSRIAERTGFLDESHFSRAFKKHYGVSPKDYRNRNRIRRNT